VRAYQKSFLRTQTVKIRSFSRTRSHLDETEVEAISLGEGFKWFGMWFKPPGPA